MGVLDVTSLLPVGFSLCLTKVEFLHGQPGAAAPEGRMGTKAAVWRSFSCEPRCFRSSEQNSLRYLKHFTAPDFWKPQKVSPI